MARRFETQYRMKSGDQLGNPDYWNRKFDDIDRRISSNEDALENVAAVADRVESVALGRLDNVITPLVVETRDRLRSIAGMFEAESASTVAVGEGTKTFRVLEGDRNTFVAVDYAQVRSISDPTKAMQGRVVSFDRDTGALILDVEATTGTGSASDWHITISSPPDIVHAARTDNPHNVTAQQVGAYTIMQTTSAIGTAVTAAVAAIKGAVPSPRDTLKKLSDAIDALSNFQSALNDSLTQMGKSVLSLNTAVGVLTSNAQNQNLDVASRLSVTQTQSLSGPQKALGLSNLGVSAYIRSLLGQASQVELRQILGFSDTGKNVQQGTGIGQLPDADVKIGWSGAGVLKATVGDTDIGEIWTSARAATLVQPNGYQALPSGLIIQWGSAVSVSGEPITFPIAFPTEVFTVIPSNGDSDIHAADPFSIDFSNKVGFGVSLPNYTGGPYRVNYIAIGR